MFKLNGFTFIIASDKVVVKDRYLTLTFTTIEEALEIFGL